MELRIERYAPALQARWDDFVRCSKNGTFLLLRGYMDYHRDRFADHSLVVWAGQELVALLPANEVDETLHSHQGLTYGGFIIDAEMTTPRMLAIFETMLTYLRANGFKALEYKTIPHIYSRLPAEEDRYALFRCNAAISRRDVLSVIDMASRPAMQQRRRRGAAKASRHGVTITESYDWPGYWNLLTDHLLARFGTRPVHSLEEIMLLHHRFRAHIRLFTACDDSGLLGGIVIYESETLAHLQYIASNERGRSVGALDLLCAHLIESAFPHKRFFDFGISNEQEGRYLNHGLIEQKEGFGGRAVVHDWYRVLV